MPKRRECPIPPEELRKRYAVARQPMSQLARDLSASTRLVRRWLTEAGIRVRDRRQVNQLSGFTRNTRWN